jgi:hypothetical protein
MEIKKPKISYTSRDFQSIKNDLVNYAKVYYPETYKDFNEASFGSLMFDLVSYVGDILSFYVDYQSNESFLETAIEPDNVLKLANQMGYRFRGAPSSTGVCAFYVIVPALTNGGSPNTSLIPILKKGTLLSSDSGASFILNEDVDFSASNTEIKVAALDSNNSVTSYAMKAYGEIISGQVTSENITIGDYEKFLKVRLTDESISEVLSVKDADGNEYYEVEYLSQDTVFVPVPNSGYDSSSTPNLLKQKSVPRRFVVDQNLEGDTYLQFGYGSETQLISSSFPDPDQSVLQMLGQNYFADKSYDPSVIFKTDKFGIVPANTTLTVQYRVNTVNNVNAGVGTVTSVVQPIVEFPASSYTNQQAISLISNFEVNNEEPIVGFTELPTIEEIKTRAIDAFSTQNRAVTRQDYINLIYRMPAKFGSVKRANVVQDTNSFKRNLNLYITSEDNDGHLTNSSSSLKKNVKEWLNNYKMVNDTVDVLDAVIVNIQIKFTVIIELDKTPSVVLNDCLTTLKEKYANKLNLGEPFYISDIYKYLNATEGVVDTSEVTIERKTGANYSQAEFSIINNTSKDGRFIFVPENVILEIKDLGTDIIGAVK